MQFEDYFIGYHEYAKLYTDTLIRDGDADLAKDYGIKLFIEPGFDDKTVFLGELCNRFHKDVFAIKSGNYSNTEELYFFADMRQLYIEMPDVLGIDRADVKDGRFKRRSDFGWFEKNMVSLTYDNGIEYKELIRDGLVGKDNFKKCRVAYTHELIEVVSDKLIKKVTELYSNREDLELATENIADIEAVIMKYREVKGRIIPFINLARGDINDLLGGFDKRYILRSFEINPNDNE